MSEIVIEPWMRGVVPGIHPVIGHLLRAAFSKQQPLFAVNSAGCFPYASGFPSIDMLGLNDFHIARYHPKDMGNGIIGHELGDGTYVLNRNPDLVQFNGLGGDARIPSYRGDIEMYNAAEFKQHYRIVFFRTGDTTLPLWVRIENGRLGITRSETKLSIPGYFLATSPNVPAILGMNGTLAASLQGNASELEDVYVPPGHWQFSIDTDASSHLQVEVLSSTGAAREQWDRGDVFSDGAPRSFRVRGSGLVYSITALRLPE